MLNVLDSKAHGKHETHGECCTWGLLGHGI